MKLWLKISLTAIIMVVLSTGVCSLIMLLSFGKSNLELAIDNTLTDQRLSASSWTAAMENQIDEEFSSVAHRSLARYLIVKFADENTILVSDDDFIYNTTNIDPNGYLSVDTTEQQYLILDIGSSTMIIVGSNITINDTAYTLYVIEDISAVYTNLEKMSYRFSLINFAVILCSSMLVLFMVRFVLKPIKTLKNSTGLIAAGIYNKRVEKKEDDEVGELAENFNSMAQAVENRVRELKEEADRRKLFMSALTHELKTPMTSISGNAQTLLYTKMDESEREDAILRIDAECLRIERLSQKMMQLIGLHQNESICIESSSVEALLSGVSVLCAEQMKQRGLKLIVRNDMDTIIMDTDLMSSLLLNLIDNAGKASKPEDTIELTAKGNVITVKDYGRGIAQDEIDKVTQPFYMVDKSRSRKAGSIGLGLALALEIAELHGAELKIESELGKGTTVKVVFESV